MSKVEPTLERLIFNLNTLAELGEEITSPKAFPRIIKSSLYMVMGSFLASKGAIFRYDQAKRIIYPIASKGFGDIKELTIKLSEEVVKEFVRSNNPVKMIDNEQAVKMLGPARAELEKLGTRVIAPLVVKDELLGFITINEKFSKDEYTNYDYQLLSIMAQHIAFSIYNHSLLLKLVHKYNENRRLYDELRCSYYDTIHAFAAAIDAKDAYTKGHSHRVSAYCAAMAREMGWSEDEIEGIRIAGLLHDIGKIAIDKSIINKASPLTKNECRELNSHPVIGYEILSKIKFPWNGIPRVTRSHHERLDGNGYPDRLKKDDIPMGARIMALADAFDAMTTDRPYRPRLSFVEAVEEVKENFGRQFDPHVVRWFFSVIRKEILGDVEHPSIIPLLQERLDRVTINRILKDIP